MKTVKVIVSDNPQKCDLGLVPGQNLYTGEKKVINEFGSCTSLERDLLNLAAGIYGADLGVKRSEREHFIRTITLNVEVSNIDRFERVRKNLEYALHILSRDNWTITFSAVKNDLRSDETWAQRDGAVLLFSGGLDSMAAASEFTDEGRDLVLVSHNSQSNHAVDEAQNRVHQALEAHYNKSIKHVHLKVYGRTKEPFQFPRDEDRENTQRTRSFLFLTLASIVTRRSGFNKILFMAENGQFAIHLPLNAARVGPFSTHTADPEFLTLAKDIFKVVLNNPDFTIENPYIYLTKSEVFGRLPLVLREGANISVTCWMISRLNKHCGYCIPCISRRIAIEFHGLKLDEYETDLFELDINPLDDTNDRRRNAVDYIEFIQAFSNTTSESDLALQFPELFNSSFDQSAAIAMYKRNAAQSFNVLNRYPNMRRLIG